MQKATATYVAPPGDSKVVEMGGVTFFSGKPVELNSYEHAYMIAKLPGNPHFDVKVEKDDGQAPTVAKRRGRPTNAQLAEAKAAADKAEEDVKTATAKAKEAKTDHDALTKDAAKPADKPGFTAPESKANISTGMAQATGHDFEKDRQDEIARRGAYGQPAQNAGQIAQGVGQPQQSGLLQASSTAQPPHNTIT